MFIKFKFLTFTRKLMCYLLNIVYTNISINIYYNWQILAYFVFTYVYHRDIKLYKLISLVYFNVPLKYTFELLLQYKTLSTEYKS